MRVSPAIMLTVAAPIAALVAQVVPPQPKRNPLIELSGEIRSLSRRVAPAVVQVVVSGYGSLDQSAGRPVSLFGRQSSTGSGVIVDSSGYIVTNAHVINAAVSIKVAFASIPSQNSGSYPDAALETAEAKIVGVDSESDLAVLKIARTLKFMNSDRLQKGDQAYRTVSYVLSRWAVAGECVQRVGRLPSIRAGASGSRREVANLQRLWGVPDLVARRARVVLP